MGRPHGGAHVVAVPDLDAAALVRLGNQIIDQRRLTAADIAFGRVNTPAELSTHPHLRRITIGTPTGPVSYPAPAAQRSGEPRKYGSVPSVGQHSAKIRAEFAPKA